MPSPVLSARKERVSSRDRESRPPELTVTPGKDWSFLFICFYLILGSIELHAEESRWVRSGRDGKWGSLGRPHWERLSEAKP